MAIERLTRRGAALAAVLLAGLALPAAAGELSISGQSYAAGTYRIGGYSPTCGGAKTFVSRELADYGASVPGTIVLNPDRLARLPAATRIFVYLHECGHQLYGASEPAADCYAAQRGRNEGWLDGRRVEQVCRALPEQGSSAAYAARQTRCEVLRACVAGRATPRQLAKSTTYRKALLGFTGR